MSSTEGSTTPTQASYDASVRREEDGDRRTFFLMHRPAILEHIEKCVGSKAAPTLLGSITAPAKDHLTEARDNGLVSWPGTKPDSPQTRVSVCLLEDRAEVDSRDESVIFSRDHRGRPTIETAEQWQKYGHDLATLADCLSRKETIRTGIKSSPAMRPSAEVKTAEDLLELNKLIADLEGRLVDVMFVDGTASHS